MSYQRISNILLLGTAVAIAGCSSDDAPAGATVPANAVAITDANAAAVVAEATTTGVNAVSFGVEAAPTIGPGGIMQMIQDRVMNSLRNPATGGGVALGTDLNDTGPCPDGGTYTDTGHSTDPTGGAPSGSGSGSTVYSNCADSSLGLTIISGSLNWSFTWTATAWTFDVTGALSVNDGAQVVAINAIHIVGTGQEATQNTTMPTFEYSYSPAAGGGFLATATSPILSNDNIGCPAFPNGGVLLITGDAGSQAEATINSDGTITIKSNGGSGSVFTEVAGSPFACATYFPT